MPKSKNRRKGRNRPRPASSSQHSRDRSEPTEMFEAAATRWQPATLRRAGWIAIGLGAFIFFQHLISQMGFFVVLGSATDDLLIGYPTGAALIFVGVMALSRADK